jgi:TPR repeat protein
LLRRAEAGESWAQLELAHCLKYGKGIAVDSCQSAAWYKLAADQGNVSAMVCYGEYLTYGGRANQQQAKAYVNRAARQGMASAQFAMSSFTPPQQRGTNWDEHNMWVLLAAAQGNAAAALDLGMACEEGKYGIRSSDHAAIYWMRQAATRGFLSAGNRLASCLIRAKTKVFGAPDVVGYSAMPEAFFWFKSPLRSVDPDTGRPWSNADFEVISKMCGCCSKKATSTVVMKRCARCQAIGYCSQDCQVRHWKLGHKTDCKSADQFRLPHVQMKGRSS